MIYETKRVLGGLVLVLLSGCGGSSDPVAQAAGDPVAQEWNSGVGLNRGNPVGLDVGVYADYVADCQPTNLAGETLHMRSTLSMKAMASVELGWLVNHYVQAIQVYADAECTRPAFSTTDEGKYALNDARNRMTTTSERAEMTTLDEATSQLFSKAGVCGVTSWQTGKSVDLLSSGCKDQKTTTIGISSQDADDNVIHTLDCSDPAKPTATSCMVIEYRRVK